MKTLSLSRTRPTFSAELQMSPPGAHQAHQHDLWPARPLQERPPFLVSAEASPKVCRVPS